MQENGLSNHGEIAIGSLVVTPPGGIRLCTRAALWLHRRRKPQVPFLRASPYLLLYASFRPPLTVRAAVRTSHQFGTGLSPRAGRRRTGVKGNRPERRTSPA